MKTIKICALFLLMGTGAFARVIPDSLGLPGDNLDLYGVLDLFKKSANPEEFEKALNVYDTKLNNLDLNNDGQVDYIHVIDRTDKDDHALVLQVAINETESQDVAVIEIEKKTDGTAEVQIVGDEALYGKNYIIEPADEATAKTKEAPAPAPVEAAPVKSTTNVYVNVWGWPSVQYIYRPSYVVWASPWRWHHYPVWWSPWTPVYWGVYHPYWYGYHAYHHRVYENHMMVAHNVYYGHRMVSTTYQKRTAMTSRPVSTRPVRRSSNPNRTYKQQPAQRANPASKTNAVPRSQGQNKPHVQSNGGGRQSSGGAVRNNGGGRSSSGGGGRSSGGQRGGGGGRRK